MCAENEACGRKCVQKMKHVEGSVCKFSTFWADKSLGFNNVTVSRHHRHKVFDPASVVNVHIAETGLPLQLPVSLALVNVRLAEEN